MGYNKTKHVASAQKYLTQGKLPQAIAEYQTILKYEPNDQITLMTVGDLFVRKGETFQAIEYFERLAQVFTRDGFLTKAIAIYKKIAKLAPEEMKPLEKLAELYVQQGVLSEARPIYLQLAEGHLKAGRREQSAVLLRKLLEAEPDNLRVQMRLADIQQATGQNDEAIRTYLHCAERLLGNREGAEAVKMAERALKIKPENVTAKTLMARALSVAGKRDESIALLESLPEIETNDELTGLLIEEHMEAGHPEKAAAFAQKIFERDAKRYKVAVEVVNALLEKGEAQPAIALLGPLRQAMIENSEQEKLAKILKDISARMPGSLEPIEWLVALYDQVNDAFHLPEALGELGRTAAAAGNLDRAKQAYELLLARAPQDPTALENLNQVRTQMGLTPSEPPANAIKEEPLDVQPPVFAEPPLDDETQKFVTASLTDVDLFSSYGLTQKAIDLLEKVLIQAPRHTASVEKLLDLYLGEGNHRRTAELAALLTKIYTQRGDSAQAERFQELEKRFQRAATLDGDAPAAGATADAGKQAPAEFAIPPAAAEEVPHAPVVAASTAAKQVSPPKQPATVAAKAKAEPAKEIDLSNEWAELSHEVHDGPVANARTAEANAKASVLSENVEPFAFEVAGAEAEAEGAAAEKFDVIGEEDLTAALEAFEADADKPAKAEQPKKPAPASAKAQAPAKAVIPMPVAKSEPAEELEYELELMEAKPRASASTATVTKRTSGPLGDLATEFEESVGAGAPARNGGKGGRKVADKSDLARAANSPMRGASDPGGPLSEIFQEFREQLDELQTDEDPETHYNLGVAYREMGLLEEAISEFQKVAQAHERGKDFRYAMQCCTLLGLAFLEKGQPEIAAFWYEKALQSGDLESESVLALRYDLGVAQQLAGHADAALKSFQQVYAMNIDYRDVSERITALRKA